MRITFHLSIGYPGAVHDETLVLPDDYSDEDIAQELEEWAQDYIETWYEVEEE